MQTRVAIGSGVVVVGDLMREGITQEDAAIGETTNLVARLQAIAEPNSLVISPVTTGWSVHSSTIATNLAELYQAQGRYVDAEPLSKRALAIWEKAFRRDHPDVATALSDLAWHCGPAYT